MITAEELIDLYLEKVDATKPVSPRRKSLAQKQGERKAARTKSRRQYTEHLNERAGYLIHNYYHNGTGPNVNNS